jgi:hypothetical protein
MNNKLWFIVLVALTLSFAVIAFAKPVKAQSNDTSDNDTDNVEKDMDHAEIMHTGLGAQVRLLQLDKAVTRNYIYGQHVIIELKARNLTANITQLEDINSQLGDVKTEIEALLKTNLTNTNETVQQFVDLKARAIDLTKQFSEIIKNELTIEQRHAIRDTVDKSDFNEVNDIQKEIRTKVWEYNADRAVALLKAMGITDQTLLDKVQSGNITSEDLKSLLKDTFKGLTKEQQKAFLDTAKEEIGKKLDMRKQIFEHTFQMNGNMQQRLKDIINDGKLNYDEKSAKLRIFAKEQMNQGQQNMPRLGNRTRPMRNESDFRNETRNWTNSGKGNHSGRGANDGPDGSNDSNNTEG